MAKQEFNKDAIWEKISNDERFPQIKSRRNYVFFYIVFLLLLSGIPLAYFSINRHLETNQFSEKESKITTFETSSKIDLNIDEDEFSNKQESKEKVVSTSYDFTALEKKIDPSVSKELPYENRSNDHFERIEIQKETSSKAVTNQSENTEIDVDLIKSDFQKNGFESSNESAISSIQTSILESDELAFTDLLNKRNDNKPVWYTSFLTPNKTLYLSNNSKTVLRSLELNENKSDNENPDKKTTTLPIYFTIQGGIGIPNYSISILNAEALYQVQLSNFVHSAHFATEIGYKYKNWDLECGLSYEHYKSSIKTEDLDIDYILNFSTNRIVKVQTTKSYLLYQYYNSFLFNVGIGRRVEVGPFYFTPKVQLRYTFHHLNQGSLLDEDYNIVAMEGNTKIVQPLSIEGGFKFSLKRLRKLSPYLYVGHNRSGNFEIYKGDVLHLRSTTFQVGINYNL